MVRRRIFALAAGLTRVTRPAAAAVNKPINVVVMVALSKSVCGNVNSEYLTAMNERIMKK
jgi:hypothetical protein